MIFFEFAILFFMLGIALYFNKLLSYFFAFLGGISAFLAGIVGFLHPFIVLDSKLFDGINLSIGIDKLTGLFIIISYLCLSTIAFYSIDFGKLFSKSMALLINIIMLSSLIVFSAKDAVTFLIFFEIVNISLFLSILERQNAHRQAYSFLAFSEGSSILLTLSFAAIYAKTGSFLFSNAINNSVFMYFAFFGFIVKMDIVPFHIWIGDTYSKAPSNIAAILSVPLTLIGAYGVFRTFSLSNDSNLAILAILLGAISAFWGALQSANEKELKKLPAYSTVENNGMILAAIGISYLAIHDKSLEILASFAFLSAILILVSHSISKTSLFLSIGHAKETLNKETIDDVSGIFKNVSKTAGSGILIAGLSFSAFPPLSGFVAEWMLLETFFQSYKFQDSFYKLLITFSGILIAIAIGLSSFGMKKLIGFSSLGNTDKPVRKIPDTTLKIAEIFMMSLVVLAGVFSFLIIQFFGYSEFLSGLLGVPKGLLIISSKPIFGVISPLMFSIIVLIIFFGIFVFKLNNKNIKHTKVWVGGLDLKDSELFRTQSYSFIVEYILKGIYRTKEYKDKVYSIDLAQNLFDLLQCFVKNISNLLSKTIMNGNLYNYVLYIMLMFILTLLIFKFMI